MKKNEILTYPITGQNYGTTDTRHKRDYTIDLYLRSIKKRKTNLFVKVVVTFVDGNHLEKRAQRRC